MGKLLIGKTRLKAAILSLLAVSIVIALCIMLMNVFFAKEVSAALNTEASLNEGIMPIDSSEQNISALYDNKVDDINDTAAIAKLLEAMKLETITGKFTVEISKKKGMTVLDLKVKDVIHDTDKDKFDTNMKIYAQQMLALITEIDKVEWSCPVTSEGSPEETITGSLDMTSASEELGSDVKSFGKSQENLRKLLIKQGTVGLTK